MPRCPAVPEGRPRISLLDVDDGLVACLPPQAVPAAREAVRAPVTELPAGDWTPPTEWIGEDGAIGLLVLGGFLLRDVELVGRHAGELLGRGDLLLPDVRGEEAPVPFAVRWTVVERGRVARLDREATTALGRWPELVAEMVSRAVRRAQWLTVRQAIGQLIRIDARLLALFWHLADRWGRVESDGVVVPLRLTHEMVARLAGAQRPSVTIALGELAERELLIRRPDRTWRLSGDPPEEVFRLSRAGQRASGA
jgi:CRP/FNR family transcriptional regulator, cyclic AMP receptor protein